jgi:hypothetical protein
MAGRNCGTAAKAFGTPKSVTLLDVASVAQQEVVADVLLDGPIAGMSSG